MLGVLNPNSLAGGSLPIDAKCAMKAIDQHIADPLGLSRLEAAAGVRQIINVAMARAIRSVTVERGRDPRDMTLFAFGGSGPAHAVDVAVLLGITKVIVPVYVGSIFQQWVCWEPMLNTIWSRTCSEHWTNLKWSK